MTAKEYRIRQGRTWTASNKEYRMSKGDSSPRAFLPAPVFASTQVAQAQVRKQERGLRMTFQLIID